jgi:hypothetical protein
MSQMSTKGISQPVHVVEEVEEEKESEDIIGIAFGKQIPFRTAGVFHHHASIKSLIIDHFTLIIDGSFKGMEAVTPANPGSGSGTGAGVQKCFFPGFRLSPE